MKCTNPNPPPPPPTSPDPPVPLKDETKSNFLYIETFLLETISLHFPQIMSLSDKTKSVFHYIDIQSRPIIYIYNTYNANRKLILYQLKAKGHIEKYVEFHCEIYIHV